MKQGRSISFYIEIVLMLAVSVLAITVLANAFSRAKLHSRNAGRLSDAVTLAASGAECFLASGDIEELTATLNEAGNASQEGSSVIASYDADLRPKAEGNVRMVIDWDEQGSFVNALITVYFDNEEIYSIETGLARGAKR